MAIAPFFMVVLDHDQKLFDVRGPMTDDTALTDRVCAAKKNESREVNCFKTEMSTEASAASAAQTQFGYTRGKIVLPL